MNKKKVLTFFEIIVAVFVLSFLCYFLNTKNINFNKIKGDVTGITGSASISCNNSSLNVGGSTTCTLTGNISSDKVTSVVGTLSASGLTINSVSPNTSIFSNTSSGTNIYYIAGSEDIVGNFTIATFNVSATSAGTGTVTFTPRYYRTSQGQVNVSAANASITVNTPTPQPSSNANLGSLSVSGANIGTFNPNTTSYGADVANSVTSVTISATPADSGATVTGTGTKSLNVGNNSFPIVVTAENGTQKTYTVTIRRAQASVSSNANIGALTVKNGATSINIGTVSATKQSYNGTVANSVTSVSITATAADSNAKVSIANKTNNSNTYTYNPSLQVGTQTFNIVITAQNGTTKKTYTVSITRSNSGSGGGGTQPKSSVSTLSSLSVDGASLVPSFAKNTYVYTATVKNSVTSTKVSAKATDTAATVEGTGNKSLNVGKNVVNVIVTAQDGSKSIYNLTIIRQSNGSNNSSSNSNSNSNNNSKTENKKDNNTSLKSLKINGDTIKLGDNTLSYNYTVLYDVEEIEVDAKAASDKAKVKVSGAEKLKVGKNTVMITVTAEDGTEKIYLVNVTRKKKAEELSNDSKLNKLEINNYSINFEPDVYIYTVKIKKEKQLDINYESSDENANVVINGNTDLKNGSVITVVVTAEDGTSTSYNISVQKSNTGLLIFFIILMALLLLGGIGFALYYFLFKNKKEKKVEEPVEAETFNQEAYDEYMKNTQVPPVETEPVSDTTNTVEPVAEPTMQAEGDIPFESFETTENSTESTN